VYIIILSFILKFRKNYLKIKRIKFKVITMFFVIVPTLVVREVEGLQVALALVEADSSYQEQNWPVVVVVVAAAAATDNNIEIDAIGSTDSIDMQMPCTDPLLLDSRDIRSVDMLEDK
jgi:hypothetical protein